MIWEAAYLESSPSTGADDRVFFSHQQHSAFVESAKQFFDRGLHEKDSSSRILHMNMRNTSFSSLLEFMGNEGWELVAFQPVGANTQRGWAWKRPRA